MSHKIFIDGQAGTTGLQITQRLQAHADVELLTLGDAERKDPEARRACLRNSDVAVLCLPDDAAREAVALANGATRVLDASTAYRTDPDWAYGVPELCDQQRDVIRNSQFVSNPGCYPQGFILLIRPLIEAGLLDAELPLRCHALSGYSGGGRQMIEAHEADMLDKNDPLQAQAYALSLQHKHVPEMQLYSGTAVRPLFAPTVAHYYQGMLVSISLFSSELNGSAEQLATCLQTAYAQETFVQVLDAAEVENGFLNPVACNGTNLIQLMVLGNADQIMLTARYDNLGKGAAGAAVQNLNLMLGLPEAQGL
ncbi:MAG: N-acetyl-gamma-glutamyl-phosphate reductase [Pseudomonadota bacterium]